LPGFSLYQLSFESDAGLLAVGILRGVFETWTIPLNGSAASRLRANTELLALSHDRKQIAWLNEHHEVWSGRLDGAGERLLYKTKPDEEIALIFWSANDQSLWFNRLRHCAIASSSRDVFVNPDNCEHSDLASYDVASGNLVVKVNDFRLTSGFFNR
jgi:hypothetical protein